MALLLTFGIFSGIIAIALIVRNGLAQISGASRKSIPVLRKRGQTDEDWLLGELQKSRCTFGLDNLKIRCTKSSTSLQEWDAATPPPLDVKGA